MLNFRELSITDRPVLSALYSGAKGHGCEYSFPGLFLWGQQQVAFVDDVPLFFSRFDDWYSYQYPFTTPELIPYLRDDAHERGIAFRMFGLTAQEVEALEAEYPGQFSFRPVRDSADYVYKIERLAELSGKKLQSKRNHCNRFEAAYPDYRVVELTPELRGQLQKKLETVTGKQIELQTRVDPAVIGGVRLELSGRQLDGTVASHLEQVQQLLRNTAV